MKLLTPIVSWIFCFYCFGKTCLIHRGDQAWLLAWKGKNMVSGRCLASSLLWQCFWSPLSADCCLSWADQVRNHYTILLLFFFFFLPNAAITLKLLLSPISLSFSCLFFFPWRLMGCSSSVISGQTVWPSLSRSHLMSELVLDVATIGQSDFVLTWRRSNGL